MGSNRRIGLVAGSFRLLIPTVSHRMIAWPRASAKPVHPGLTIAERSAITCGGNTPRGVRRGQAPARSVGCPGGWDGEPVAAAPPAAAHAAQPPCAAGLAPAAP